MKINKTETTNKTLFNAAVKMAHKISKKYSVKKTSLIWTRTKQTLRINFPSLTEQDYNNVWRKANPNL